MISVPQTINEKYNKLIIPLISNCVSGKKTSTIQINPIIITIVKRFKVIILRGRVMAFKSGLRKNNNKPITAPTKTMVITSPFVVTPSMKYTAKPVLTMPTNILVMRFAIIKIMII